MDTIRTGQFLNEHRREKGLTISMVIFTILAIMIIILLPTHGQSMIRSIILVIMVAALAFIGNMVILVALGMNKKRCEIP